MFDASCDYCRNPVYSDNNFIYTNWGVVCNPNTKTKLAQYGVEDFGQDLADSTNTYFILQEAPHNNEHPVLMYFRHTYDVECEVVDMFTAGDTVYAVYQLH